MNIHVVSSGDADGSEISFTSALRSRWPSANITMLAAGHEHQPDRMPLPDLGIILDGPPPENTAATIIDIRQRSACPIVVVARESPRAAEAAWLLHGADVVVRPNSLDRLMALLEVLGRGAAEDDAARGEPRIFGDLRLDASRWSLSVAGSPVTVTPTEFRLIEALAAKFGGCVPSSVLMRAVWGLDNDAVRKSLKVHVSRLRHKLARAGSHCTVNAIRGYGYSLACLEDVSLTKYTPPVDGAQHATA